MAVANDNLERDLRYDPQLARIYAAAGDAEDGPPVALDAAILATARREVGAGPAVLGAAPRTRRQWFVPLSIAAVLMLSVSLVTLVHEEKGDDLTQAPASAPIVSKPAPASAPPVAVQERDAKSEAVGSMKDSSVAESAKPAPDRPKVVTRQQAPEPVEAKRKEVARSSDTDLAKEPVASVPASQAEKRVAQAFPKADAEASAPAGTSAGATANAPAREAEVARDAAVGRVTPASPPTPSAPASVPAESARRPDNAATSTIGIRGFDGGSSVSAPASPAAAAAKSAPAPSAAKSAEGYADGRVTDGVQRREKRPTVAAVPSPAPAASPPADRQLLRSTGGQPGTGSTQGTPGTQGPRPSWLASLDNQPAGKWLEKLAELRREGRTSDAEQLLAEFRRRFPDHPASR